MATTKSNCCCKNVLEELQIIRQKLESLNESLIPSLKVEITSFLKDNLLLDESVACKPRISRSKAKYSKTEENNNEIESSLKSNEKMRKTKIKPISSEEVAESSLINSSKDSPSDFNTPKLNFSFKLESENVETLEEDLNRTPLDKKSDNSKTFLEGLFSFSNSNSSFVGETSKAVLENKSTRRGRKRKL